MNFLIGLNWREKMRNGFEVYVCSCVHVWWCRIQAILTLPHLHFFLFGMHTWEGQFSNRIIFFNTCVYLLYFTLDFICCSFFVFVVVVIFTCSRLVSPSRSNMTHMDSVHAASVSTLSVLTSLIYSFECVCWQDQSS